MTRTISRRSIMAGAGAGAIGALAAPAILAQSGPANLTFAFAPDESGAVQALIDGFNESNDGRVEVSWRKAPEQTDAFYEMMVAELNGGTDIDIFGADVIWTASLAQKRQIADVTRRFYSQLPVGELLSAAADSVYFRNRIWAAPWYTDAGMLFYRRDLLEQAGISEPPQTWDEVSDIAQQVMEASGTQHGLVLQGGNYEGGTVNALEFIWSAGGRAWTLSSSVVGGLASSARADNAIVLNSQATVNGLQKVRDLVDAGVIPQQVAQMNERDSLRVFGNGDAVFMRNWPFAYRLLGTPEFGPVSQDQVGITRIPTLTPERQSYSCLGGWNLAIAANSPAQDAAWSFISYALQREQQRGMAETGGYLPVLAPLYEDEGLRQAVPVIGLGQAAVSAARSRPSSPIYTDLSPVVSQMFNDLLTGAVEPQAAVEQTQAELRRIAAGRG